MRQLITGGIKSGKSSYAIARAMEYAPLRSYIATAMIKDDEIRLKIERHRHDRGNDFETVEEPVELSKAVRYADQHFNIAVIDCINMWVLNMIEEKVGIEKHVQTFIDSIKTSSTSFIIVTNEVGCGIVPDNPLSRRFVDELGRINQRIAGVCDEVLLMVVGVPVKVKVAAPVGGIK